MRSDLICITLDLIRTRLDLIRTRLDLIRTRLDLIRTRLDLIASLPMRSSLMQMRSGLVVRESDCQCTSCKGPGFDPSIRRHSGICGVADEAVLNIVWKKLKNPPKKYFKKNILLTPVFSQRLYFVDANIFATPIFCRHHYFVDPYILSTPLPGAKPPFPPPPHHHRCHPRYCTPAPMPLQGC